MKYGLEEENLQKIKDVFSAFPQIEKAILFGSRAMGNFKSGSDIDIVLVGKNLSLSLLNKVSLLLDELFLPQTFDLCIYHQITNKDFLKHIERVGVVLYSV